jgi:hypothetical protein
MGSSKQERLNIPKSSSVSCSSEYEGPLLYNPGDPSEYVGNRNLTVDIKGINSLNVIMVWMLTCDMCR